MIQKKMNFENILCLLQFSEYDVILVLWLHIFDEENKKDETISYTLHFYTK